MDECGRMGEISPTKRPKRCQKLLKMLRNDDIILVHCYEVGNILKPYRGGVTAELYEGISKNQKQKATSKNPKHKFFSTMNGLFFR